MSADNNSLQEALSDLRARRDAIDEAIAGIEKVIAILAGDAGSGNGTAATTPSPQKGAARAVNSVSQIRNDTFFGMSAPEAVKAYLRITKEPKSVKEIIDALLQGGFKTTSSGQKLYASMFTTMKRLRASNQVVQPNKGVWGLMEWYPALRNKRSQRDLEEVDVDEEEA